MPSTTISLPLNGPKHLLVAVAATDSNGDSGILSDILEVITPSEMITPPEAIPLLSPDYIPQDVVIVTDPANQEYVLKWKQPTLSTDNLEVVIIKFAISTIEEQENSVDKCSQPNLPILMLYQFPYLVPNIFCPILPIIIDCRSLLVSCC